MAKIITTPEETKVKLAKGIDIIVDTVATTLGSKGLLVGLDYGYEVKAVRDGVTVANQIESEDPAEYFAVRAVQQACRKQVSMVGDGSTVVAILTKAIYKECMKNIAAGTSPMSLVEGLEKGRDILLEELTKHAIPVKSVEQAVQIATIASQDKVLGQQIGEIIFKLGLDGVVTTDESATGKTYVETQVGMQFEQGYVSPMFITDPARMEATVEGCRVLLTDREVKNVTEFAPLLEEMAKNKITSLVVIAPEVTDTMLGSMIVTKLKGGMNLLAVKAPYTGQVQKDFLDDLAVLTGARVVSRDAGDRFESVTVSDLGKANRITATEKATIVVGLSTEKKAIAERVKSLKALIARDEGSDYQKEKLKERFAKLTNGIAVVKVGAPLEMEMKNWIERAKDAIEATQAALKEGIVPGGEVIYLTIRNAFEGTDTKEISTLCANILAKALEQPFKTLLENADLKPDKHIEHIYNNRGIDVNDGKMKDMIEAGIIDPALVASQALINAVSVAIMLMTTKILVLPKPEEKKNG